MRIALLLVATSLLVYNFFSLMSYIIFFILSASIVPVFVSLSAQLEIAVVGTVFAIKLRVSVSSHMLYN